MGLIISKIELDSGLEIMQPYARIDTTNGNKEIQTFSLFYYLSKEHSDAGKSYLSQQSYDCPVSVTDDSPNFIKQEYEYLKTLPDFEGAIDA